MFVVDLLTHVNIFKLIYLVTSC